MFPTSGYMEFHLLRKSHLHISLISYGPKLRHVHKTRPTPQGPAPPQINQTPLGCILEINVKKMTTKPLDTEAQ